MNRNMVVRDFQILKDDEGFPELGKIPWVARCYLTGFEGFVDYTGDSKEEAIIGLRKFLKEDFGCPWPRNIEWEDNSK
jgi:hypothetical protein